MSNLLSFGSQPATSTNQNLVGLKIDVAQSSIAALRASGTTVRVLIPGQMAPKDYRPERVNVHVDQAGKITGVYQG